MFRYGFTSEDASSCMIKICLISSLTNCNNFFFIPFRFLLVRYPTHPIAYTIYPLLSLPYAPQYPNLYISMRCILFSFCTTVVFSFLSFFVSLCTDNLCFSQYDKLMLHNPQFMFYTPKNIAIASYEPTIRIHVLSTRTTIQN